MNGKFLKQRIFVALWLNGLIFQIVCYRIRLEMSVFSEVPKQSRFCVINCENSKRWDPISFNHMFQRGLQKGLIK